MSAFGYYQKDEIVEAIGKNTDRSIKVLEVIVERLEEIRDMMLRHARLQLKYKGEFIGIREMRKHVAWYTKGLKGSAKLREEINRVESYQELEELLFQRL